MVRRRQKARRVKRAKRAAARQAQTRRSAEHQAAVQDLRASGAAGVHDHRAPRAQARRDAIADQG